VTETTTIRIPVETKDRLNAHKNGDQSIGDVVTWLADTVPISTEITRKRDAVASYLFTHLVRDFGQRDELTPGQEFWRELGTLQHGDGDSETAPRGVILDHTALAMLGAGNRLLAQLVYAQADHREQYIFAPAEALYTATVQRNGVQQHVKNLKIKTVPFDLGAIEKVGERIASNATSAVVHVVHAADASPAWPTGLPVVTTVPEMYQPYQLRVYTLPEHG
jgi:hypothetical protein